MPRLAVTLQRRFSSGPLARAFGGVGVSSGLRYGALFLPAASLKPPRRTRPRSVLNPSRQLHDAHPGGGAGGSQTLKSASTSKSRPLPLLTFVARLRVACMRPAKRRQFEARRGRAVEEVQWRRATCTTQSQSAELRPLETRLNHRVRYSRMKHWQPKLSQSIGPWDGITITPRFYAERLHRDALDPLYRQTLPQASASSSRNPVNALTGY